jgi:hypothetical protein
VEKQRKAFTKAERLHLYELICQNCDDNIQPSGVGGFVAAFFKINKPEVSIEPSLATRCKSEREL